MNTADHTRVITAVEAAGPANLTVVWSDGIRVRLDLSTLIRGRRFQRLRDPAQFVAARVGDWGHSVEWPCGIGLGADRLWLETLSATGHDDTRAFMEWRLRHGLSLSASAQALGLSRRTIAYYSNGERKIPRPILLACRGWEADQAAA